MAENLGDAVLYLKADGSQLESDMNKAQSGVTEGLAKAGRSMQKVGVGLSAAVTLPLVGFGKMAAEEFGEAQRVSAQTAAVLTSTGGAAKVSAKHIMTMAGSLSNMSGVDDELIQSGQNLLLTFTNIQNRAGKNNDVFDQASQTMLDFAVAMNTDPKTAALQLGKALNDPEKGMAKLTKVGVTFTEQQKKQVAAMMKAGDVAGAQKVILAELNKEFGGSAAAAGKTLPGQINKMKNAFAELGAGLLETLIPTFKDLVGFLQGLITRFQALSPQAKKFVAIGLLIAAALGPVLIAVGSLLTMAPAIGAALAALTGPVGLVILGIIALGAAIIALWQRSAAFRAGVIQIWEQIKVAVKQTIADLQATFAQWAVWAQALWTAHGTQIMATLISLWDGIKLFIQGAINIVRGIIKTVLAVLRGDWSAAWQGIKQILTGVWQQIRGAVTLALTMLKLELKAAWTIIKTVAKASWEGIKTAIGAVFVGFPKWIVGKIGDIGGALAKLGLEAGHKLGQAIKDGINAVLDKIRGFNLPSVSIAGKKIGGGQPFSGLPRLAKGGVVTRPTIAMIGEAGPEAVVPLSGGGRGLGITQNFHFQSQPDMFAVSRQAAFSMRTAGLVGGR